MNMLTSVKVIFGVAIGIIVMVPIIWIIGGILIVKGCNHVQDKGLKNIGQTIMNGTNVVETSVTNK